MSRQKSGFTLVELLVVVAILSIMIALLLPALNKAMQQSYATQCASNLRQQGMALLEYAQDNNDRLPDPPDENVAATVPAPGYGFVTWQERLTKYVIGSESNYRNHPAVVPNSTNFPTVAGRGIFRCPVYPDLNKHVFQSDYPGEYAINPRLTQYISDFTTFNPYKPTHVVGGQTFNQPDFVQAYRLSKLHHPVVVVGEGATTVGAYYIGYYFEYMRHGSSIYPAQQTGSGSFFAQTPPLPALTGGANYLWNDGHVSFESAATDWVRCQSAAGGGINTRPEWCPWLGVGNVP
jgi:prepilin-type N-terminal cleavage/methylation domain-containing protein/prepilin-type processing-associated H-X9-DG protein